MKASALFLAVVFLFSLSLQSCGVMFGGSKFQGTVIAKDHPNAEIYVNGKKEGIGTAQDLFYRNQPLTVTIKDEGCKDEQRSFQSAFRTGNFVLSLVSWGLVGIIIDLGTGASYKPDHRLDDEIERDDIKNFSYTIEMKDCKE